ncbi:NUDIX hydrolase [Planomonospora parontospora subsp. parontospora]|uniref:NUDIX hydrolase n=2 Tax=Planomonospora parontospora TaxID=58119 RepID=A0AA37BG99_9ACTN|nr:NUDIX hydrolase [Planomonospora parontospora]GGK67457.1 NUDIX hydrolase [Planomonospora parontospora]GII09151.1 NUDIX hydrolase [Planomonospora parontospora subsp. parontospora]
MTEPVRARTRPGGMIRAAGAVVWRGEESAPEIAVVHRPGYGDWSLPKGKLKQGEHVIAGALREVAEETGATVVLGRALPPAHYMKGGRLKRVDYWVARAVAEGTPTAADEVDEVAWLPPEEAWRRLTYEQDAELLRSLFRSPSGAPLATVPLVLVRHGVAGSRDAWEGDDDLRPLDGTGRAQAGRLADALAGYRPVELVSSPSLRCVQTLEPYAGRAGLEIRREPLLSESRHDPAETLRVATALLESGAPAALCSHGKVLPGLIAGLVGGPDEVRLDKGAFLVVHRAGGRIVAADRYPA